MVVSLSYIRGEPCLAVPVMPYTLGNMWGSQKNKISPQIDQLPSLLILQTWRKVTYCGYSWIKDTFKRRECIWFQKENDEPTRCQCGRLKEEHIPNEEHVPIKTTGLLEIWKPETHTRDYPTDAFGELEFQGAWTTTRAKYARISNNTKAEDVLKLFTEAWGLELPKLIIEVTGGAKDFVLQPKLKQIFRQGIVNVAVSTNAWIITGGTNTGVMKHVGQALREHTLRSRNKIHAIGIASWGIVNNREDLIMEKKHDRSHKIHLYNNVTRYRMTSSEEEGGAALDPNHTHFVLVDNGTVGKYGVEIELRSMLEKLIAQQKIDPDSDRGVPAVCLALEGGINTIRTVLENVSKDPPIPVVIAAGSGRGADLIAFAYECASKTGLIESRHVNKQLRSKVIEAFPKEVDQHEIIMQDLKKIVTEKHLITVFSVDDENANKGIDHAILTALLKASNLSVPDQLKLALVWNIVDITQEQIFSKVAHWNRKALEEAMEIALTRNRVDFFKPILEQGLLMTEFLDKNRLSTLYSSLVEEPFPTLDILYKCAGLTLSKGKVDITDIGLIIQSLLGTGFASNYTNNGEITCGCLNGSCFTGQEEFLRWIFRRGKVEENTTTVTSRCASRHWSNEHQLNVEQGIEMRGGLQDSRSVMEDSLSQTDMRNNTLLYNRQLVNYNKMSFLDRVQAIFQAPIVKFWINAFFYLCFLFSFTVVVLYEFNQDSMSTIESIVAVTVFSMGTEEIRQVLNQGERDTYTCLQKIKMWAYCKWNIWDFIGITLYAIGFVLRWPYGPFASHLVVARIFLVMDIMMWYIRLLNIFSVNKVMGPYVNMIGKMVWDMVYFTVILLVFLISYGVARQSILYPSPEEKWVWSNLVDIFAIPYWQIYGELFMDDRGKVVCHHENDGDEECAPGAAFVAFVMSVYLLISNVLLINMLIAIFNNTFLSVQENANEIWKLQRYRLIMEYSRRPCLPPPFIMIEHVWMVIKWVLYYCCKKSNAPTEIMSEQLLYNFEEECMENYLRQQTLQQQASVQGLLQRINDRVEAMSIYMDELKRSDENERRLRRKHRRQKRGGGTSPKKKDNKGQNLPTQNRKDTKTLPNID